MTSQRTATEGLARRGELYPSVILHGASDDERREAAIVLARLLLCEASRDERPCGTCRHCTRVEWPESAEARFHPDFRILERDLKTSISVEATKQFLQLAQLAPFEARGQVFVVASAESLTGEAANALLKTLEEPPGRTPRHFLLLTPSHLDLLPTIRSRSLPVYLGPGSGPDPAQVAELAERFAADIRRFVESGSSLHLLAAAEELLASGSWQDPRAAQPWTLAAAAVMMSRELLLPSPPAGLLALSEDLLTGWRFRLRGIQAQRIVEGMITQHMAR